MTEKKVNKIWVISLLTIVSLYFYNTYFFQVLITGKYTAEIPNNFGSDGINDGDKLELFNDNTFKSNFRGIGTYKLIHNLSGTKINLDFGNDGLITYFYRPYLIGKPKIVIFRDLNSGFQKD
ncbi:hypothetical protein [uncultured Polaribacter sp.]|uniref:hypothetical protein n=1 Tax=uncultured Polaribacter sp. TaxID=174711 RepID=UPI00262A8CFF|nr:hypothetical protein [uncultured Polaribacter sp.]